MATTSVVIFLVACGSESSSNSGDEDDAKPSSSSATNSSADESLVGAPIQSITVSGVSQKGPFLKGSSITIQELDGKTLAQTGKSFKVKISNDNGEFSIPNVSLSSQYALLEATGYYRKESCFEEHSNSDKSDGPITLNALVDLSNNKTVNINILTHLEYERTLYLVENGMKVPAAKKQAQSEVLKAFGFDGESESAEKLNILTSGDDNAALLAISVLMSGDRYCELKTADISERLADFAYDIKEDGKWDDVEAKFSLTRLIDSKPLNEVRTNMEAWTSGKEIPDFESKIKQYEQFILSIDIELGECSAKNDDEIKENKKYTFEDCGKYYTCHKGEWEITTQEELVTNGKKCSKENIGDTIQYEPTSTRYGTAIGVPFGYISFYRCTADGWEPDQEISPSCSNEGYFFTDYKDKKTYICHEGSWKNSSDIPCSNEGEIIADSFVCIDGHLL